MNKKALLVLSVVVAATAVATPSAMRWRENARRASTSDVPQSQRELRVPSEKQLQRVFPGDARRVLEESDKLTLLSINPSGYYEGISRSRGFQGYTVLGQTTIQSKDERKALIASFYDGLVSVPGKGNFKQIGMGCFNPRHGIRAERGGKTVDLVICFGCFGLKVYENGKLASHTLLPGAAPQPYFNSVLTQARVPLNSR